MADATAATFALSQAVHAVVSMLADVLSEHNLITFSFRTRDLDVLTRVLDVGGQELSL